MRRPSSAASERYAISPSRASDASHHAVTGVDALRAADALHLQALADVDVGRADGDAETAVDAVAALPVAALLAARLPTPRVVGHDERVGVEQHTLEAGVRDRGTCRRSDARSRSRGSRAPRPRSRIPSMRRSSGPATSAATISYGRAEEADEVETDQRRDRDPGDVRRDVAPGRDLRAAGPRASSPGCAARSLRRRP